MTTNDVAELLSEAYSCRTYDVRRSIDLAYRSLTISKELNDKSLIGSSLNQLSLFFMIQGSYKRAISLAKAAIKNFEELGDEKGVADANFTIASVHYKTDNYHLGLTSLIQCLNIYQKFDDYHNQARVLKSLGTIYEYFGDQKNAIKSYHNAINRARKAKDLNLLSNTYNPLSGIYLKQNKVAKAMKTVQKSIELKHKTGDTRGLAFAIYGRGKVYIRTGDYELAEADLKNSIAIHTEKGEKLGLGMAYQKLGQLYVLMGELQLAKETLQQALSVSERYNIVIIMFKSNYLLYQIAKMEHDNVSSLKYLELYLHQKEAVINTQSLQIIENYELINKMNLLEKEAQLQKEKAEMMEKKDRAEQNARMKQDFLSTMSHEIRTPLNAVTTITALLTEKYEGEDKVLLSSLKAASRNLLLVINDILDFTKLDNGKMVLEERPTKLNAVLNGIFETYESLAFEKGLKFEMLADRSDDQYYLLDETKLSQILGNLVSNAIKYTDHGKVTFEITRLSKTDTVEEIRFKVTDTGVGIPDSYFDEMFESFSQPKSVTTRKQGGTGLGLAIVKKLIEMHGSQVEVSSKEGVGSVFYFDLRLKMADTPGKSPAVLKDRLQGKSVLLVEDNMVNAMVAKRLLSNWGMTTEHALNGVLGVEKAAQRVFDFVLMDIHMPEMNGFDATSTIRNTANHNQTTPIFALTADITTESQEQYTNYFNGFLRKPIEIDKLYEALLSELC